MAFTDLKSKREYFRLSMAIKKAKEQGQDYQELLNLRNSLLADNKPNSLNLKEPKPSLKSLNVLNSFKDLNLNDLNESLNDLNNNLKSLNDFKELLPNLIKVGIEDLNENLKKIIELIPQQIQA